MVVIFLGFPVQSYHFRSEEGCTSSSAVGSCHHRMSYGCLLHFWHWTQFRATFVSLGWAATLWFSDITAACVPYLDLTKKKHTCVAFHNLSPFLLSWTSIINGSPVPWFVENPISLQQFFRIVHLKRVTPDILNGPNSILTNMRVCQNHLKGLSTPACWVLPNRGSHSVHLRWDLRICISSTSCCCSKDPTLRTTSPTCVLSSRH